MNNNIPSITDANQDIRAIDYFYTHLKECLRFEVLNKRGEKKFSWLKVFSNVLFSYSKRYYFWWRIANYLHTRPAKKCQKWARKINNKLIRNYGADIDVRAFIGPGMTLNHFSGIVIRGDCVIGRNVSLCQNTTIGRNGPVDGFGKTAIGDDVVIGAHSCVIGDVRIGNNVIIGAMTFVNKDIPDNSVVYSEKKMVIRELSQ
ncbi:serine acetyltransferase [Pantoea sp.]|uniref:serine acetyltransferase n=1 Tax=Pantoea sp. TaxID=69393 RepID=UPI0028979CD4|nr:serine acetyltransferase [Pantoea sp.]